MSVVIKTWGNKWLKNSPEKKKKNNHENKLPFNHHRRQNCSQMRCFSKVFHEVSITNTWKYQLHQNSHLSNREPFQVAFLLSSPLPSLQTKKNINIHVILGASLDKCLNIKLKLEVALALAKERGTRREADSQVNISLYLKKPEHILKLLLIFMPTSHRPPSSAGGEGDAGGTSARWLWQLVQGDRDTAGRYQPNYRKRSRNKGCFSSLFSAPLGQCL